MVNKLLKRNADLLIKQQKLEQVKAKLKTEFMGIDKVIDEVVNGISAWYLFPDLQEKPTTINLWGLTGVGKSSLVNRLAELIGFQKKYYRFDLGEIEKNSWMIRDQLENIYKNNNGSPIILSFDEFQHTRSLTSDGAEIERNSSRIIWQLLDSGLFQIMREFYQIEEVNHLIIKLSRLLLKGVKVEKGKVVARQEYFINEMELVSDDDKYNNANGAKELKDVFFVPVSYHQVIYDMAKDLFSCSFDLKEKLHQCNGRQTISLLTNVLNISISPKTVDCTKALIFTLGNLDEAYTMSNNFNPDMDADEFHEQSQQITVPAIKRVLQRYFRNEQISRLGNKHIIYPAFSKNTFKQIISLQLEKIAERVFNQQQVELIFDNSVRELLYREGVYPSQGARPVLSTIHHVINANFGQVFAEMILQNLNATSLRFRIVDSNLVVEYYNGRTHLHSLTCHLQLNLEQLRKDEKDDLQAIIAVHEAGHAIISAILLNTLPDIIFSNSADKEINGFVSTKFKWKYISRKEIKKRLAMFLAGFAAEKIIFGNENVTAGAEDDIGSATAFITDMLKANGMRSITAAYDAPSLHTRYKLHTHDKSIDSEAETYLKDAFGLAEKTLLKQKLLLLKMADYLSDHRKMEKQQIKEMLIKYAIDFDEAELIEDGRLLFYRDHLKKSVESAFYDSGIHTPVANSQIFLNSTKKQVAVENDFLKTRPK
jgi:hypothetical protein